MKHAKTAAVVAGSMMALGSAGPSFAAEGVDTSPSFSLNGGLQKGIENGLANGLEYGAGSQPSIGSQMYPLTQTVDAIGDGLKEESDDALGPVSQDIQETPLLGGLPVI